MRSRWEAVHKGLVQSIRGLEAARKFVGWRARSAALKRFADPMDVVGYLACPEGDLDDKERLIWSLIDEVRRGGARRLAHSILLLGFWRALDAIFVRRSVLFQGRGADLDAELIDNFVAQIHRMDPTRVKRVAATLVRNTERDAVASRRRELARAAQSVEVTPDVASTPPIEPGASSFNHTNDRTDEEAIGPISLWLERVTGRDASLVVDVVIRGRDTGEIAAALGIPRKTLNKRIERALARARRSLVKIDSVSPEGITLALVTS